MCQKTIPSNKSTNNCILTKDGKTLIFFQNHNIPVGVSKIGNKSFMGCNSLESIELPDSVTEIEYAAFMHCTSLQSIVIPDSVIKIVDLAFTFCTSLQSIAIATQEKDPDLSREKIEYLLQELSKYSKEIHLRVPISRGYAYRHYPAFEGKFKKVIVKIDV